MDIKNKIWLIYLFIFVSIMSMGIGSAATTINAPAASATVSCPANTLFNVSTTDVTNPAVNLVNITIYAQSTLTANSSWVVIGQNNSYNTTTNNYTLTNVNFTNLLEDANNYIFNATVRNTSNNGLWGADTNTGMTVDCTVPVAASALSPADKNVDGDGSVAFSGTVTAGRTTSCTLQFDGTLPPGGNAQAMTHSGSTCTLTIDSIPDQTYTWFIRASDETNTTDSSSVQVTVDQKTSSGKAAVYIAEGLAKSKGGSLLTIVGEDGLLGTNGKYIIVIIIIGIVGYLLFKKK